VVVPVNYYQEDLFSFIKENKNVLCEGRKPLVSPEEGAVSCCGDFQIAHRDMWYKVRGFEESMIYRDCADGNLMIKGIIYGDGCAAVELKGKDIFHLNHGGHVLVVNGTPQFNNWNDYMYYKRGTVERTSFVETKNPETWGFSDYDFFEEIV
jgi:hypothetical protein